MRGLRGFAYDRSALSVHCAVIDKLGYGTWASSAHPAQDMFSFTRWGVDIPETLTANRVVTPCGFAYTDVENPFEPLLEVALVDGGGMMRTLLVLPRLLTAAYAAPLRRAW